MPTARTEFSQAIKAIATERGLDADVILDTIKQAIIAAYRRDAKERGEDTETLDFDVEINASNGEARVFAWPLEKPDERKEVTPPGFGRIAAQTAKQVIHQKIREAEKGVIMGEFSERVGALISGMILRFDGLDVRVDLGRTEGLMPASERTPNERLNPNQRMTFLLKEIIETPKGKQLVLSRSDPNFVMKLFEREVPEIGSKSVQIKLIAREAGVRTKIAVFSVQSGVDPVGSCVGQKGVRVQAVTNELGGERVDIIPWSESLEELITASLSPAEGLTVVIDQKSKSAIVSSPADQLSLAIGKDGQNARLAAKLTGYKIELKGIKVEESEEEVKEAAASDSDDAKAMSDKKSSANHGKKDEQVADASSFATGGVAVQVKTPKKPRKKAPVSDSKKKEAASDESSASQGKKVRTKKTDI